jgi:hypothetical protein
LAGNSSFPEREITLKETALAAAQALYLFSPLLVASPLSAVVLRFDLWSRLKRPIDGELIFYGQRLFGDSKTWRGIVVAVIGCIATVCIQKYLLHGRPESLAVLDYRETNPFTFGATMGATAMVGELPNSFAKRRLRIAPGKTIRGPLAALFYIWDQVDLLTTAWPALLFWVHPTPRVVVMSFVVGFGLHPLVSAIGYLIGARRSAR